MQYRGKYRYMVYSSRPDNTMYTAKHFEGELSWVRWPINW